ncbi:MAG: hypothetical protein JO358_09785 [Alphaproteobacteria bacterium]|nr:hypothetical protein [Alphaproteobacteria bacterium]
MTARLDVSWCQITRPEGVEIFSELSTANIQIPVVFITGYGDIPMSA